MIKVNTALQAVISFENETDNRFINSINDVYAPLFELGLKRASYREQQKGVAGNGDLNKAFDRENGIRDENNDYIVPKGMKAKKPQDALKSYWSNVEKLAHMNSRYPLTGANPDGKTELEITVEKVGGNTIPTICKNISLAGSASRSAKSKAKSGKAGKAGKDDETAGISVEEAFEELKASVNPFLKALNTMIAECPDMDSAQYAKMIIKLMPIAQKQFPNVEGKAVMALLENPAMLKKTG